MAKLKKVYIVCFDYLDDRKITFFCCVLFVGIGHTYDSLYIIPFDVRFGGIVRPSYLCKVSLLATLAKLYIYNENRHPPQSTQYKYSYCSHKPREKTLR